MAFPFVNPWVDKLIDLALEEDIGSGDITTNFLIPADKSGKGDILAKEDLLVCGLDLAERIFRRLDPGVVIEREVDEGQRAKSGQTIIRLQGALGGLLTAERTALNFLQRLSGIATHTAAYVQAIGDLPVRLVDTRKTAPGWRVLEKYAVRTGGAENHRMGLYDGVLIKDNHIAACGGIKAAVQAIRQRVSHLVKVEVETADLDEVRQALDAGADVIMLDNMDLDRIREAVTLIGKRALVEISGGVTLEGLRRLADTGVDLISVGALTHAARAVDLSMRIHANR